MKITPELRHMAVQFEVRADGDKQVVRGHAAVFNTPANIDGLFEEQFSPGAFSEFLRGGGDVVMLWNHNPDNILGRLSSGTLRIFEDERGLAVELDPPSSAAREVEAIIRGDIKGMSVRFRIQEPAKDQSWEQRSGKLPLRTINRAGIIEVSPAAFPYYKTTDVSVRSSADVLSELNSDAALTGPPADLTSIRERFEFMQRNS